MRLVSFRVTRYRSIEDSGEVSVDENITTFVGINESGKTNLMRALKKLNQNDLEFDDVVEDPNWHFGSFDPEEIFVKATFKLHSDEIRQVSEITNGMMSTDTVTFSKNKRMELSCSLHTNPDPLLFAVFRADYLDPIADIIGRIDAASLENGQEQIAGILNACRSIGKGIRDDADVRQPSALEQVRQRMANFQQTLGSIPQSAEIDEIGTAINKANSQISDNLTEVRSYLTNRLPQFIYFENTAIIDSRIHLPTFVKKIEANVLDEDEKTTKTLLDIGNLRAAELFRLGRENTKKRSQVLKDKARLSLTLSKASKKVSDEIDGVWSQNEHNIEFEVLGNDLRVWVTNKYDNVKLQLEERSRGYQWFFSFYTVFNAESEQGHKDAIILLDEPALFLHAKGQSDFLKTVLPELATKNQIIYTTHSPFMVDLAKPNSIHTVTLKDTSIGGVIQKATNVSGEVWDNDRDALFPLQSALHYTMAQSMFIGTKNLIVEGVTDFWLLKGMSNILESAKKSHLDDGIAFVPAAGATKTVLLASMYKSQELDVVVLLDADKEGKLSYESITKNKILRSQKVLLLNEVYGQTNDMTIEDLFPEDFYLKFVEITYQDELRESGIDKIVLSSKSPLIVRRLECFFEKENLGRFHKSRPARAILTELGQADIGTLPEELVKKFEMLFDRLNRTIL